MVMNIPIKYLVPLICIGAGLLVALEGFNQVKGHADVRAIEANCQDFSTVMAQNSDRPTAHWIKLKGCVLDYSVAIQTESTLAMRVFGSQQQALAKEAMPQFILDVKNANDRMRISEAGVNTVDMSLLGQRAVSGRTESMVVDPYKLRVQDLVVEPKAQYPHDLAFEKQQSSRGFVPLGTRDQRYKMTATLELPKTSRPQGMVMLLCGILIVVGTIDMARRYYRNTGDWD